MLLLAFLISCAATVRAQFEEPQVTPMTVVEREAPPSEAEVESGPGFALTGATYSLSAEHSTGGGAIVTTSKDGFAGTIKYTCVLTTKTKTATPPECGMYPATATISAGGTVEPEILIFGKGTKLPKGVTLGSNSQWIGAGSAVLACCLLFGVPARQRKWQSMLSAVLLLVAMAGFTACATTAKMISHGVYAFSVTGTDSENPAITSKATINIIVY